MSLVDEALVEINQTLAVMRGPHEGLRDFARLDLPVEAQTEVAESIAQYDQRTALLKTAEAALVALRGDGYPALPPNEVPSSVLDALAENQATVTQALATFVVAPAATLGLAGGAVEPKG